MIAGLAILGIIGIALVLLSNSNPAPVDPTAGGVYTDIPPVPDPTQQPSPVVSPSMDINPSDRNSWPTGDKIWNICQAIAVAEGYGPPGNLATRCKNPGDMGLGDVGYGTANESDPNNKITVFATHMDGWNTIYRQILRIANGQSGSYPKGSSSTWGDIAHKWAASCRYNPGCPWLMNMTNDLGVDPGSTIGGYLS